MKTITVSAPGKLMLLGDHAVVYQRPCLVTAVDSRVIVEVTRNTDKMIRIEAPQVKVTGYQRPVSEFRDIDQLPKGVRFVETVTQMVYAQSKFKDGVTIITKNGFSCEYGLGSSSAVSVCVVKALAQLWNKRMTKRQIFDTAYQAILEVQGVGSGFDVAAAIWGGTLYYKTAGEAIEPLGVNPSLVVAYSGKKADTATLVKRLAKQREKQEDTIDAQFDHITDLVEDARGFLEQKQWKALGKAMIANQKILDKLGVSTPMLHRLCIQAVLAGAHGAKLSGAGGGDCMIALVDAQHRHAVEQALVKAGGVLVPVKSGAAGVKVVSN